MRKVLDFVKGNPWLMKRLCVVVLLCGVGSGSFFYGQRRAATMSPGGDGKAPDPNGHVAYLYNNIPVTRAELGEYLVARLGLERLDFMLNRKIVQMACEKQGIVASDTEVEQRYQEDIRALSPSGVQMTREQFVNNILKRFGKTEYEWREDVIRPKILMEKLVKAKVTISDKDIQEGFEAKYGPRVECRMIVIDKGQSRLIAQKVYENAKKGTFQFLEEASKQVNGLASSGGKVPAIHKHFGDEMIERTAFSMKEGDISPLLDMKDGNYVILMCEKHLPRNALAKLPDEREKLAKEMYELRVAQKIPEEFARLRDEAAPKRILADNIVLTSYTAPAPSGTLPRSEAKLEPTTLPPVELPKFQPREIEVKEKVKLPDGPPKDFVVPPPPPPVKAPTTTVPPTIPTQPPMIQPPPGVPTVIPPATEKK